MKHFPVGVDCFSVHFQRLVAPRAQWQIAENVTLSVDNIFKSYASRGFNLATFCQRIFV